jgi:hypothetical protein
MPSSILSRPVRANRPNDVVRLDITTIQGFFGLFRFELAVIFDDCARMSLTWQTLR